MSDIEKQPQEYAEAEKMESKLIAKLTEILDALEKRVK